MVTFKLFTEYCGFSNIGWRLFFVDFVKNHMFKDTVKVNFVLLFNCVKNEIYENWYNKY